MELHTSKKEIRCIVGKACIMLSLKHLNHHEQTMSRDAGIKGAAENEDCAMEIRRNGVPVTQWQKAWVNYIPPFKTARFIKTSLDI